MPGVTEDRDDMGNATVGVDAEVLGDEMGREGVDVLADAFEGGGQLPQEGADRDDDDEDQQDVPPDESGKGGAGRVECPPATPRLLLGRTSCAGGAHAIVSFVAAWTAAARRARRPACLGLWPDRRSLLFAQPMVASGMRVRKNSTTDRADA